jgi:RimJ/RimL family protein N-acetyltransferase
MEPITATHQTPDPAAASHTVAAIPRSNVRSGPGDLECRPLGPDDAPLIVDALEALSDRSRRMRFASPTPRLSDRLLRHLCAIDGRRHIAWGFLSDGRLVAMGRLVRFNDEPEAADVSLTVTDGWQGRGLGPALLHRLAEQARDVGVERFSFTVSGDNRPAQKLLERLGVRLRYQSGLGEGSLPVASLLEPAVPADLPDAA